LLVLRGKHKTGKFLDVFGNIKLLLARSALNGFFGGLVSARLDDMGIGGGAASAGTRRSAWTFVRAATGAAEIAADGDDGAGAELNVEFVVVTIGDGAFLVVDSGENDAAGSLHGASVGNVHHFGHAASDGERCAGLHGDEQATFANETLKIGEALVAEAAANVVGRVETRSYKVGSFGRIFPGAGIPAHWQATKDGAQTGRAAATHRRKDDNVKLFAKV